MKPENWSFLLDTSMRYFKSIFKPYQTILNRMLNHILNHIKPDLTILNPSNFGPRRKKRWNVLAALASVCTLVKASFNSFNAPRGHWGVEPCCQCYNLMKKKQWKSSYILCYENSTIDIYIIYIYISMCHCCAWKACLKRNCWTIIYTVPVLLETSKTQNSQRKSWSIKTY